MRCLPFSSSRRARQSGGSSKHRFSWGFFSIGASSEGKRSSQSAPASSSLHPNTQQPPPSSIPDAQQQASSLASHGDEIHEVVVDPASGDVSRIESDAAGSSSLAHSSPQTASELRVFTYTELRAVTKGFSRSNLIGEGGFGCVYRGTLNSADPNDLQPSKQVAVKLLNRNGQQGHKEWMAEVRFLGLVEHPNLVHLVGYCAEDDERGIQRLLVYEYMARGSLEGYLFRSEDFVLPWQQRLQIMLGAAQGLAYLHEEIEGIQVIFRDFKTSNVLLDDDFTPKLSDFGLARQGPEIGASHVSTSVVGTIGYAAPEYVQTGHLTSKSDVWSFGVVLFEMLSARRSVDRNRPKSEQHLLEWVRPYVHGTKKIHAIMDPRLAGDYSLSQAHQIVELALLCSHRAPKARPSMSVVVRRLKQIVENVGTSDTQAAGKAKGVVKPEVRTGSVALKRRKFSIEDVRKRMWAPKAVPA
eukprot:c11257_g1_i1 orf=363-1769(-)